VSLVEAIASKVVGFAAALLTQIAVFPVFGLQVSLPENLAIGLLFITVSTARSSPLRPLFEAIRAHGAGVRSPGPDARHRFSRRSRSLGKAAADVSECSMICSLEPVRARRQVRDMNTVREARRKP
jgi:hypothetical protein